jgi:hypothetical protein
MSLSVVPHAAEPTKHGVPTVAAAATPYGINSFCVYIHGVSYRMKNPYKSRQHDYSSLTRIETKGLQIRYRGIEWRKC